MSTQAGAGPIPEAGTWPITAAGLRLDVQVDAGALGFLKAFERVRYDAQDGIGGKLEPRPSGPLVRSRARLRIETGSAAFDRPRYAGLEVGQYRVPGGAFVLHSAEPRQIQGYWPGVQHEELDLVLSPQARTAGDLLAHPAHEAMTAWLGSHGRYALHAAGVECGGRGVLLVGEGGQGKTTTALAAVQRGFGYLGDDVCWLSFGDEGSGPPMIHGIYATCKLNPDSRQRLGLDEEADLGTTPGGKTVHRLPGEVNFRRSAPLAAIVLVSSTVGPVGSAWAATPLNTSEAIRVLAQALAPYLRIKGPTAPGLSAMTMLQRQLPIVRLPLTWHLDALVDRLAALV